MIVGVFGGGEGNTRATFALVHKGITHRAIVAGLALLIQGRDVEQAVGGVSGLNQHYEIIRSKLNKGQQEATHRAIVAGLTLLVHCCDVQQAVGGVSRVGDNSHVGSGGRVALQLAVTPA